MKRIVTLLAVIGMLLGSNMAVSAAYPDPGPGRTNIFIQNIGANDATVSLVFTTGETGGAAWSTDTGGVIKPKASKYVLYSQFQGTITDGWAGAVEVSATEPLAAIVNMFWDSGAGVLTAATYTGIDAPATSAYLPLLAVRETQTTRITVQNTEDADAHIVINFYSRDGSGAGNHPATIPPKSEKTFYLDQIQPNLKEGLGSAHITSDRKIAAVCSTHWNDASEAYSGVAAGDTTLWIPSVFRKVGGNGQWNYNAVIIQNLGGAAANVHVEFYAQDGSKTHEFDDTIQSKAAQGFNTYLQGTQNPTKFQNMVSALGNFWQGTMKVTCTNGQPLAGVSFLYAYMTDVRDTISYNAIRDTDAASKALSCPAVYRKRTGGTDAQWSTTLVQNLSPTAGTLQVEFYGTDGVRRGGVYTIPIAGNGTARLNLKDGLELPGEALNAVGTYFAGGLYVTPSAGLRIIGVTNLFWDGQGRASGYDAFPVP